MTCTYVPSVDIKDENLQNTCPSGKLLACAGYWTAPLLHHGHRNKIMGMGVHNVPTLQKSHPGTQASPTCPLMASHSDILLAHRTILPNVWKAS